MKIPLLRHLLVLLVLFTIPSAIFSQRDISSFEYDVIYMDPKSPSSPADTIPDKYLVMDEPVFINLENLVIIMGDKEYSYTKDQLTGNHLLSEGGNPRVYIPIGKANEDTGLIVTGITATKEVIVYNKVPDEIERLLIKQEREKIEQFEKKYDIKQKSL